MAWAGGFFGSLGSAAMDAAKRNREKEQAYKDYQVDQIHKTIASGTYSPLPPLPPGADEAATAKWTQENAHRAQALEEATQQAAKLQGGSKPIKEIYDKFHKVAGLVHKHTAGGGQAPAQMTPPPSTGGGPPEKYGAGTSDLLSRPGDQFPASGMGRMGGGGGTATAPPPQAAAPTQAPPTLTKPPAFSMAATEAAGNPSPEAQDERKAALYQRYSDIDRAAKIAEEQAKPVTARTAAAAKPNVLYSKSGEPYAVERPSADGKVGIFTPDDPDFSAADQRTLDAAIKAQQTGDAAKAAKAPYNVASELHKEHPDWTPEKIQSVIAAGRQTGLGTYAMVRLLDFAAKYDPTLLSAMPEILRKAGINLPPGVKLPGVPAGMPTDEKGNPIGLGMPGAPTGPTRARGQLAEGMLNEIPRIRQEIVDNADLLGPAMGRWNEFMTGQIGGNEDDPNYGRYQALRTDMLLLSSGAAKMHLNSVRAVDEFNRIAQTGKMTPDVLNNFVRTVETWANTYANQGRGRPPAQMTGPPSGKGGVVHWKRDASGNPVPAPASP